MGRQGMQFELFPQVPPKTCVIGFFGVPAEVAEKAWNRMEELDLLPPSSKFQHHLWVLAFMRTYPPNDTTLSRLLGGKDPKTIRKYMYI